MIVSWFKGINICLQKRYTPNGQYRCMFMWSFAQTKKLKGYIQNSNKT